MVHKIRVILDAKEDVFRDILFTENHSLFDLHQTIKKAFNLKGEEMASFFQSNDQWYQGSEIPLENMSEDGQDEIMENISLQSAFREKGAKMIYVYDFFSLWTFYVELIEIQEFKPTENFPKIVLEYGVLPLSAPDTGLMDIDFDADFEENEEDFLDYSDGLDEFESDTDW